MALLSIKVTGTLLAAGAAQPGIATAKTLPALTQATIRLTV